MSHRGHRVNRLTVAAWVATFGLLLLAGTLGRAWALPGLLPLGQTIPLPPTATPTNTVSAQPTATWTPRPTWTQIATEPPALPTDTATPAVSSPTGIPPVIPTSTERRLEATATSIPPGTTPTSSLPLPTRDLFGTPSPPLPTPGTTTAAVPSATPSAGPVPLVLEVVVLPQVAGPGDSVQLIVQVANVGYAPVDDVQVEGVLADDLHVQFVECARCSTDCPQCTGGPVPAQLTIFIGRLLAGDQLIAPVHVRLADDIWPGQTLQTSWTLSAAGLPDLSVQAGVVLPWAPLPATGGQ